MLNTVKQSDNFIYRILDGEVIKIDEFPASCIVIDADDNLNYPRFQMTDQLDLFIARSLEAKRIAEVFSKAQHGFVDGDHIRKLAQTLDQRIAGLIAQG